MQMLICGTVRAECVDEFASNESEDDEDPSRGVRAVGLPPVPMPQSLCACHPPPTTLCNASSAKSPPSPPPPPASPLPPAAARPARAAGRLPLCVCVCVCVCLSIADRHRCWQHRRQLSVYASPTHPSRFLSLPPSPSPFLFLSLSDRTTRRSQPLPKESHHVEF